MSERQNDGKKEQRKRNSAGDERRDIYRNLTLITQFTLYMIVPIGGMSALGYFLDRHFGTSWIIIVCFFVGAIAGGQSIYRLAMKIANEKKDRPEENIINRRKTPENKDDKSSEKK